jgi:hypothetical protein
MTIKELKKLTAQKTYIVNDYIENEASGECLIGAAVYDSTAQLGTVSNNYGYFNLSIPAKAINIEG